MQTDTIVIAIEIRNLEWKMVEGMCAVHDHRNIAPMRHFADSFYREYLSGTIRDMAHQDQLGLGRNGLLEAIIEIVHAGRRHRKRDGLEHDSLAPLALPKGVEHARIILIGGQHLVATLQI